MTRGEGADREREFRAFYDEAEVQLRRFLSLHYSSADVKEIVNDAFHEVYQRWATIDSPKSYLYTVATRLAIRRRPDTTAVLVDPGVLADVAAGDGDGESVSRLRALAEAINQLPDDLRAVMVLVAIADTPGEIAATLNVSERTVRRRIRKGQRALIAAGFGTSPDEGRPSAQTEPNADRHRERISHDC